MNLSFFIRQSLENLHRMRGGVVPEHMHPDVKLIDIDELPIGKRKESRPYERDPAELDTIVVHVSGVPGFSVREYQIAPWRDAIKALLLPPRLLGELRCHTSMWNLDTDLPRNLEAVAQLLALLQRYRDTPYAVLGIRQGWVVRNRRPHRRSSHAGPYGNDYLGVCVLDSTPNEKLTDRVYEVGRRALGEADTWLRSFGDPDRPIRVIAHRQVAAPWKRGNDCGDLAYDNCVRPVVEASGGRMWLDPLFTAGKGVAVEW